MKYANRNKELWILVEVYSLKNKGKDNLVSWNLRPIKIIFMISTLRPLRIIGVGLIGYDQKSKEEDNDLKDINSLS